MSKAPHRKEWGESGPSLPPEESDPLHFVNLLIFYIILMIIIAIGVFA